jgi:2-polyprenyl-3-methyl-5-hydroxy-6-metoxy-1,4-benzoquinol methylase
MKNNISFVDFYNKHNISPVSQDISNLEKHFQRRNSLLTNLGIPALFVKGSNFLEFGPGSGHNATYIASLSPNHYHLVDGSDVGVKAVKKLLSEYQINDLKVIHSLFLEYKSDFVFDIVWAEGCVPHQSNPIDILKHLSSFTKKSGVFVVSTINGISHLSETIRRLFASIHTEQIDLLHDKLDVVRPLYSKHLKHLKGMSRPVDDWIIDGMLQPTHKSKLLSIPDTIQILENNYNIYNTSPKFIQDWRWYKDITGKGVDDINKIALNCYYSNNLNLIDYRFEFPAHSVEFGMKLENLCAKSWNIMCSIQNGDSTQWKVFYDLLDEVSELIKDVAPETAMAIIESSQWLQDGAPINSDMKHFQEWWGRGQQYVSLIRK